VILARELKSACAVATEKTAEDGLHHVLGIEFGAEVVGEMLQRQEKESVGVALEDLLERFGLRRLEAGNQVLGRRVERHERSFRTAVGAISATSLSPGSVVQRKQTMLRTGQVEEEPTFPDPNHAFREIRARGDQGATRSEGVGIDLLAVPQAAC